VRRSLSPTILLLAVALILVPAIARALQQVERRDATRLSIKHSWIGIAPPTKASIARTPVAAVPVAALRLERPEALVVQVQARVDAPRAIVLTPPDPSRGPPSSVR
jgi:hypothetical protein